METITLRVEPDTLESLDAEADERDVSRSEYVREILRTRDEVERIRDERDDLTDELEHAEARLDDLRRQLAAANRRNDDVQELVEYVEGERELQTRREERRSAPAWRRAKWWLFGQDVTE